MKKIKKIFKRLFVILIVGEGVHAKDALCRADHALPKPLRRDDADICVDRKENSEEALDAVKFALVAVFAELSAAVCRVADIGFQLCDGKLVRDLQNGRIGDLELKDRHIGTFDREFAVEIVLTDVREKSAEALVVARRDRDGQGEGLIVGVAAAQRIVFERSAERIPSKNGCLFWPG